MALRLLPPLQRGPSWGPAAEYMLNMRAALFMLAVLTSAGCFSAPAPVITATSATTRGATTSSGSTTSAATATTTITGGASSATIAGVGCGSLGPCSCPGPFGPTGLTGCVEMSPGTGPPCCCPSFAYPVPCDGGE